MLVQFDHDRKLLKDWVQTLSSEDIKKAEEEGVITNHLFVSLAHNNTLSTLRSFLGFFYRDVDELSTIWLVRQYLILTSNGKNA